MHPESPLVPNRVALLHGVPTPEPTAKTILLVDDDPDIRSLIRTFLEHEGYRVLGCGDAGRATQIVQNALDHGTAIDLLITDLYMPGHTGMELGAELKMKRAELPVLLISGGFLGKSQMDQMQREGWSFLGKPFALPELLAMVHGILGAGRLALEA